MDYILVFLAGWFLGRFVLKFMLIREALKSMNQKELNQLTRKRKPEEMPILHTENVGDTIYLYDTATNMYMCKGFSIEEIAFNLTSFCHINSAQVTHADKKILIVDGKVA